MSGPAVLVSEEGAVRVLTLNRPRRRNALDLEDRQELLSALMAADAEPSCRVIVLTGTGPTFCAGGDISSMTSDRESAKVRLRVLGELTRALVRGRKPVIAAVTGGAIGLGLSLAAAADYVVADRGARFVASFGKLGLVADTGLFWSLAQRVGPARAKELMLFATELSAVDAHRIGLVSEVVEPGGSKARALEQASSLAEESPDMIAATKRIIAQADQDLDALLESEAKTQLELLATEEFARRQRDFVERRRRRN